MNHKEGIRIIKEMNSFIFQKDVNRSEAKASGAMNAVHKHNREQIPSRQGEDLKDNTCTENHQFVMITD